MTAPAHLTAALELWAVQTPGATAVEDEHGTRLSYEELNELAEKMASHLRLRGVEPGDRVGVCLPKSLSSVVCLLASLKARAAYVPVDAGSPADRNRFIFEHCKTRVVCTDEVRQQRMEWPDESCVVFPGDCSLGATRPWPFEVAEVGAEPAVHEPGDLTYILYTSGSTGLPKGVVHTQSSAMSFVQWSAETFGPRPEDRFSSHAPFHFDLSIFDLYVPQQGGAALVLIGERLGKEPANLAQFVADKQISVWYSTPSMLTMMARFGHLDQQDHSPLRSVLFAGEVFPMKYLSLLRDFWPHPDYYNLYGPTETNVCTYFPVPPVMEEYRTDPYPIGGACSNVRARVTDPTGAVVEDGEGLLEIHASGPTMNGYWHEPEQTHSAFATDADGQRWYRTGDVVKEDENGDFVFLGRRDRMVKRRGYRIELDEIEAGLYQHPSLREVGVVAHEDSEGTTIIAFLSADEDSKPSIIALKQHCAKHLPSYMNPDRFRLINSLPRTSTDKVDYQTLLKMED